MKNVLIILLIAAGLIGGLLFLGKKNDKKDPIITNNSQVLSNAPADRVYGTGVVQVVEFGDFQCPGCGAMYPVIRQVKETYKDKINFSFKHFPLQQIHPNARAAHRAAQAAANQGKFWEMFDQLYQNQKVWEASTSVASIFESYATSLGLNMDKYKVDVASSETNSIINADIAEGEKFKVDSTPTFFIDGKKVELNELTTADAFGKIIDAALASKNPAPQATPAPETPAPSETPAQ